jgi:hypothetical protein
VPSRGLAGGSDAVRAFYDRYPYLPPVTDLDVYRTLWMDLDRRRRRGLGLRLHGRERKGWTSY